MTTTGKIVPCVNSMVSSKLSTPFDENPVISGWILETNSWADGGKWIDTETWND